ncbi:MAG: ECF-type sigma factor, partial [Acidobacteriota bacterium]
TPGGTVDLLDLDHALDRLAEIDGQAARIIDLRCFAGLTIPETAKVLGTGTATVSRRWQVALAWLRRELGPDPAGIGDLAHETPSV